jgi:hypothetical protein
MSDTRFRASRAGVHVDNARRMLCRTTAAFEATMGSGRCGSARWGRYQAQEPGDPGVPDIKRPPDREVPGMGNEDFPAAPGGSGAPPFTGEDLEDVGPNPRNQDRPMM